MAVIEVEGLRKEYHRPRRPPVKAVDGLDLSVPEGGVFGFLGPNGSGKTTTIRCLLGLVRPTAGVCRVLGADAQKDLPTVIPRVGALVETPGVFPGLTARQNMALLGRLNGIGAAAVTRTLEQVGLAERADDPVRGFSLGMRQRLGLAVALLKEPALLVLDEPANGLDPAGIKEVRDLLLTLGREGRTVFLSSHLLSEVQHTCDNVAILSHGRCVAAGSVQSVLTGATALGMLVRLAPGELHSGLYALRSAGLPASLVGDQIRVEIDPAQAATVTKILSDQDMYLTELRPEEVDLETVFLQLTEPNPS
ncbi:MAG: type transport system ATP-binding protein [Acidimicrobiaceae bacterium]|jgi:ABC-2 type transport system ATP-binding protein|nr:type transport system ATP-binding protein [Acidimicrobiaceae bacterium]